MAQHSADRRLQAAMAARRADGRGNQISADHTPYVEDERERSGRA